MGIGGWRDGGMWGWGFPREDVAEPRRADPSRSLRRGANSFALPSIPARQARSDSVLMDPSLRSG